LPFDLDGQLAGQDDQHEGGQHQRLDDRVLNLWSIFLKTEAGFLSNELPTCTSETFKS
jgi:hypothetical protein